MAKKLLSLSIASVGGIQASSTSRTLAGELVRFGVPGRTSIGVKRVRAGALRFPDDLTRVKLTKEHFRDQSRGYCNGVEITASGIRAAAKVSDGPEGDDALREAADGTRDGFSFDVIDATVDGDEITDALVIAIGQVGIPAYDDSRIDTIAASAAASTGRNTMLSPEQAQRLLELQAQIDNGQTLSDDDQKEYDALKTLSALQHAAPDTGVTASASSADQGGVHVHVHNGPAPVEPASTEVTASAVPAVPAGGPAPESSSTTAVPAGGHYRKMIEAVTAAMRADGGPNVGEIRAALTDVISTDHTGDIEQGAWSGELWSGLQYEAQFSDLFNKDSLTNWEGRGWRFTATPAMQDYAGDKAAIPSGAVTTEDSNYTAAREAVGVDVDRKFYDFPNEGFLNGLFEKVRESWEIILDAKVKAYVLANVVAGTRVINITKTNADATIGAGAGTLFHASDVGATITGSGIPAATTIASVTDSTHAEMSANATNGTSIAAVLGAQESSVLKAAARAALVLKRRRVGQASWIYMNDEDLFSLMEVSQDDVPAFLSLYNITPSDFRSSPDIPQGTVLAGARQAAVVRTLPGSPIRVSAQHLANGGIDEAFFGYWAIEEHHTSGIASVVFKPA